MHANMKTDSQARKPLTEMQEKVLAYIQARVLDDGMPPTHEEIRCAFGLKSSYGVRQHLRLIRDKGYIDLCAGKSRGIRLQAPAREEPCGFREIPIVGQIAAGRPILAEEHLDGRIAISAELFPSGGSLCTSGPGREYGRCWHPYGRLGGDPAAAACRKRADCGGLA